VRGLRTSRLIAAGSVLLAGALAVPSEARVRRPQELTATTVVRATQSGYVDVIVPVDARLSAAVTRNPDVRIAGKGRFVGVWLQREGAGAESVDGIASTRLPSFLGGGHETYGSYTPTGRCTGVPEVYPVHYDCTAMPRPKAIVLHEGAYRLTVLTDGSPVTITLSLHGLDRRTTHVRPAHHLASTQQALPERDGVGDQVVTYGGVADWFRGPMMTWVLASAKAPAGRDVEGWSVCARSDTAEPPPLAYSSQCLGGDGGSYVYHVRSPAREQWVVGGFVSTATADADVGLGGSFTNSDGVQLGSTLGVWMEQPPS
jgi:hypothetical protein